MRIDVMRQWFIYLFLLPASVVAEPVPVREMLTLDQAVVDVLENNPTLIAAGYESKAAAARIRAEKMSPGFSTTLDLENFGGTGLRSGTDVMETTLSLSKVLELGEKSELRSNVAQQKAMLLRNEQDAVRLDLLAETTKRFIQVVTDQEKLKIARQSLAIAEDTEKMVKRRVKAGKSANTEIRRVKINVARKSLQLEHAEHELASSRVRLAIMWGKTQPEFSTAFANLFDIKPVESFDELAGLLQRNPDLVRFATEERLNYSRLQLTESSRKPDVEVTGGLRHYNLLDDAAFVFSLNIPLGTSSRAAPKAEEVEFMRQREPHLLTQRTLELYAALFEVYQESSHAFEAVTTLRQTIIPQAASALNDYEKGYAAGRYSFLELTEAQNTLIESRLEAIITAADYHRFQIELDRLTGAGLSSKMPSGASQ
jgi:cobalt-zinc-cadmium efflux system outer membrane protein